MARGIFASQQERTPRLSAVASVECGGSTPLSHFGRSPFCRRRAVMGSLPESPGAMHLNAGSCLPQPGLAFFRSQDARLKASRVSSV
jgi:hypothetical protein